MGKYGKAFAAVLSNVAILGGAVGLNLELSPETIGTLATIVNGIIVWAVPNKA